MQDPECIHTCFEVSVKLQGAQEGAGRGTEEGEDGEMEELKELGEAQRREEMRRWKSQRSWERHRGRREGEMEKQKPQQCHCQPQACQDHRGNLQSQGRGSFFVSSANEADTSLSSLNQSDHQAQPKLIHS